MNRLTVKCSTPLVCKTRSMYSKNAIPVVCKTSAEAVQIIKSKDIVYVHSVAASPKTLMDGLASRAAELRGVQLCHIHLEKANPCLDKKYQDSFFVNHYFVGANARSKLTTLSNAYTPIFLSDVPKLFNDGYVKPDVALLNVSPPHGYCSLGVEVAASLAAVKNSKIIVAQVNKSMPRTIGQGQIHYRQLDYVLDVDEELPQFITKDISDVERKISQHIAELIPDGATLQMGIGNIPNAVLSALVNHQNLGVHTEMFSDGLVPLLENGVVNNLKKSFMNSKTVTSFIMGSQKLYDYVNDNLTVIFLDASVVNNPAIIGSNPKVVAINSAVEVDLTGQVCADSVGSRILSGVGGQVDFERGAAISKGGIPIICLPSTLAQTGASKIVSLLRPGAGVTTSRSHVHWVVTEYGKTNLFGKNLIQRAKSLIQLAHPAHRETLEKEASKNFSVKAWEWEFV